MGEREDHHRISSDPPESLRTAIGDAIIVYSRIENIVLEMLWEIRQSPLNERRALAKKSAAENLKELRKYVEAIAQERSFDGIWEALRFLRHERTIITHGLWTVLDDVPSVAFHKEFIQNTEEIVFEQFDGNRFNKFMDIARVLPNLLIKTREHIEQSSRQST